MGVGVEEHAIELFADLKSLLGFLPFSDLRSQDLIGLMQLGGTLVDREIKVPVEPSHALNLNIGEEHSHRKIAEVQEAGPVQAEGDGYGIIDGAQDYHQVTCGHYPVFGSLRPAGLQQAH